MGKWTEYPYIRPIDGEYLVSTVAGSVVLAEYEFDEWYYKNDNFTKYVVAFMPKPEPYIRKKLND